MKPIGAPIMHCHLFFAQLLKLSFPYFWGGSLKSRFARNLTTRYLNCPRPLRYLLQRVSSECHGKISAAPEARASIVALANSVSFQDSARSLFPYEIRAF